MTTIDCFKNVDEVIGAINHLQSENTRLTAEIKRLMEESLAKAEATRSQSEDDTFRLFAYKLAAILEPPKPC